MAKLYSFPLKSTLLIASLCLVSSLGCAQAAQRSAGAAARAARRASSQEELAVEQVAGQKPQKQVVVDPNVGKEAFADNWRAVLPRPLVGEPGPWQMAYRGASAAWPEHSIGAYKAAIEDGRCNCVMTFCCSAYRAGRYTNTCGRQFSLRSQVCWRD